MSVFDHNEVFSMGGRHACMATVRIGRTKRALASRARVRGPTHGPSVRPTDPNEPSVADSPCKHENIPSSVHLYMYIEIPHRDRSGIGYGRYKIFVLDRAKSPPLPVLGTDARSTQGDQDSLRQALRTRHHCLSSRLRAMETIIPSRTKLEGLTYDMMRSPLRQHFLNARLFAFLCALAQHAESATQKHTHGLG